jgi:hypothetical protein
MIEVKGDGGLSTAAVNLVLQALTDGFMRPRPDFSAPC